MIAAAAKVAATTTTLTAPGRAPYARTEVIVPDRAVEGRGKPPAKEDLQDLTYVHKWDVKIWMEEYTVSVCREQEC